MVLLLRHLARAVLDHERVVVVELPPLRPEQRLGERAQVPALQRIDALLEPDVVEDEPVPIHRVGP